MALFIKGLVGKRVLTSFLMGLFSLNVSGENHFLRAFPDVPASNDLFAFLFGSDGDVLKTQSGENPFHLIG